MQTKERKELIDNIIKSPANQFGENEEDRGCLEATPDDTLAKLMPAANADLTMQVTNDEVTNEAPLVTPEMNFEGQEEAASKEKANQPLTVPVMSFEK